MSRGSDHHDNSVRRQRQPPGRRLERDGGSAGRRERPSAEVLVRGDHPGPCVNWHDSPSPQAGCRASLAHLRDAPLGAARDGARTGHPHLPPGYHGPTQDVSAPSGRGVGRDSPLCASSPTRPSPQVEPRRAPGPAELSTHEQRRPGMRARVSRRPGYHDDHRVRRDPRAARTHGRSGTVPEMHGKQ